MGIKKVLIVEDDTLLATTFSMFVEDLGYKVAGIVSNGKESIELCKKNKPDIVLMDIHLPGKIDGIKAAEEIQENLNIPIIFITSDEQESTVKRALASNSYGYLLKPVSKNSLKVTIELALEKHKNDNQIKISRTRYKTLVEDSPDTVLVINADYIVQYINFSGLKLFGTIHIEEIVGKSLMNFFIAEDKTILKEKVESALKNNKKIKYFPLHFKSFQEKEFQVGISGSVIEFNKQVSIQLVITDHTEKITSQQLINKQINIIENIDNAIIIINTDGTINYCNKVACDIFGFEKNEITGKNIAYLCQSDDNFYNNTILLPLKNSDQHSFDMKLVHNNTGQPFHVKFSLTALKNEDDNIFNIVCYCHNISFEEKLETICIHAEANFKAILHGSSEAIFIINKEFQIINYNKTAIKYSKNIFNKPLQYNISVFDVIFFLNKGELIGLFNNAFDGVSHYLERLIRFEKHKKFFIINLHPILNVKDENVENIYISFLDISEKKLIEKELEDTKSELKPMFDSSIQRFYLVGINYKLIAFNKSAYDTIQRGFNRSLKKGDYIVDFISSDITSEEFIEYFESAKKGNHVIFKEKQEVKNDFNYSEVHLEPIVNDKGDISRILLWTLDITKSEKTILALKESEDRYSLVAKGGNDGLWDWNLKTDELFLSPRWKSVLGYDENEFISRDDARELLIYPDDIEHTKSNIKKHLKGESEIYINEYRLRHKNGEFLWIHERGLALRDENGKPYRMAGTITDISERKKNEEELQLLNKALLQERSMFMKGNVVVFRLNTDGFIIEYLSSNIDEVLGYSADELIANKTSLLTLIVDEDKDIYIKERDIILMQKELHTEFSIYRLKHKNGNFIHVKDFISVIKNEDNNNIELLGYFIDVTSEKKIEEKIVENQKKYFNLFSQANDAILLIDQQRIIDCNVKAEELFGYLKEELLKMNIIKLSPKVQPNGETSDERRTKKINEAYDGISDTFYWQYKHSEGKLFDAEVSLSTVEFDRRNYLQAIIRDISERKQIEKDLRISEERYRSLLESMPDTIFILDKNGNYFDYKQDYQFRSEEQQDKVIGKNLKDFFDKEKEKEFLEKINNIMQDSGVQHICYDLDTSKGTRNFEARLSKLNSDEIFVQVRDFTGNNNSKN